MRSNSKQVREQVRAYILECVTDFESNEFETFDECKKHAQQRFEREYNYEANYRKYPNLQERFMHYCMGMAFDFTTYYSEQREILNSWGLFKEKASDEEVAHLYFYLIFAEIFKK
jgi:hypothetical protein